MYKNYNLDKDVKIQSDWKLCYVSYSIVFLIRLEGIQVFFIKMQNLHFKVSRISDIETCP